MWDFNTNCSSSFPLGVVQSVAYIKIVLIPVFIIWWKRADRYSIIEDVRQAVVVCRKVCNSFL